MRVSPPILARPMRPAFLLSLVLLLSACDSVQNFDTPAPPPQPGDPIPGIAFEAGMEWTYSWSDEDYVVSEGSGEADSLVRRDAFELTARVVSVDAEVEGERGLVRIDTDSYENGRRCRADWFRVSGAFIEHVASAPGRDDGYIPPVLTTYRNLSSPSYTCGTEPQHVWRFEDHERPIYPTPALVGVEWEWPSIDYATGDTTLVTGLSVVGLGATRVPAGTFATAQVRRTYSTDEEGEYGTEQLMEAYDYVSTDGLVLREDVWTGDGPWGESRERSVRRLELLEVRRP